MVAASFTRIEHNANRIGKINVACPASRDARSDPSHLPLADVLLPADHDFWRRWHPPFGMDCRCGALPMTRDQVERLGLLLTSPEALDAIEAGLRDEWPLQFIPLLDFRSAAEPSREPAREPRLTTGQFADVMRLFGSVDGQAS